MIDASSHLGCRAALINAELAQNKKALAGKINLKAVQKLCCSSLKKCSTLEQIGKALGAVPFIARMKDATTKIVGFCGLRRVKTCLGRHEYAGDITLFRGQDVDRFRKKLRIQTRETLRKNLGGTWFISNTDEKTLYFGVPQLQNIRGQRIQICPLAMVTTALGRRRGSYIRMILTNMAWQISLGWHIALCARVCSSNPLQSLSGR